MTNKADQETANAQGSTVQHATLGGGCFWCVEAVLERLDGVESVVSGYAGGKAPKPTYRQVCTGETGHAEVVDVKFDSSKISFEKLLEIFFQAHDPTTLNRQGHDVGTQYRSVIFYRDENQKKVAEASKKAAGARLKTVVVTEIVPLKEFYVAEDYHQDYFRKNPNAPYCAVVIAPKLRKLADKLAH